MTTEPLTTIRNALAHIPAVKRVDWSNDGSGRVTYYVTIDHYDPAVTYAIAKALAGTGVYYHVVPEDVAT